MRAPPEGGPAPECKGCTCKKRACKDMGARIVASTDIRAPAEAMARYLAHVGADASGAREFTRPTI